MSNENSSDYETKPQCQNNNKTVTNTKITQMNALPLKMKNVQTMIDPCYKLCDIMVYDTFIRFMIDMRQV